MAQADVLMSRFGFHQRKAPVRISQILRMQTPELSFLLLDADGSLVGAEPSCHPGIWPCRVGMARGRAAVAVASGRCSCV